MNKCVFCKENRFKLNIKVGLPAIESLIYKDENVIVCPDLSPLVKGHVLIISQNHFPNFALSSDETLKSMEKAKNLVLSNGFYKNALIFEHGTFSGGASIEHAHMHIVPINGLIICSVRNELIQFGLKNEIKSNLFTSIHSPYLYVEQKDDKHIFMVNNLPSQFMRKMIRNRAYDWKQNYTDEISKRYFLETLELFI